MSGIWDQFKDRATSAVVPAGRMAGKTEAMRQRAQEMANAHPEIPVHIVHAGGRHEAVVPVFHAKLDYPPSANRYWRTFRNVVVKSKEAREYQKNVALRFAGRKPMRGPVSVVLNVFRPKRTGDLDNSIKVLLDALKGIAYVDDSQVVEIHAWRNEDKFNPRVVVKVSPA